MRYLADTSQDKFEALSSEMGTEQRNGHGGHARVVAGLF